MARQVLPIIGAVVGAFIPGVGPAIGWAVGSMIGNAVDPLVVKGPSIGDIAQQTSQEGVPRPIIFARSPPIAGNIIATSEPVIIRRKESQGKGGPKVKTESVYRTYAVGVCEGPISAFVRVWRNGILVYDAGAGITADNAKFLEFARFFIGSWGQNPSPDLETIFGVGTTAAHRGTAYMVMAGEDLTDLRGSIPQWLFQVERCAISLQSVNDECDAVITWSAFDGADSYRLHRMHDGLDEIINDADVLEFLDTDVEPDEVYQYFVRPVVDGAETTQSNTASILGEDCVEGTFMTAGRYVYFGSTAAFGFGLPGIQGVGEPGWGSMSPTAYYNSGPSIPPIYVSTLYWDSLSGNRVHLTLTTQETAAGTAPTNNDSTFISVSFGAFTLLRSAAVFTQGSPNGYGGAARRWSWTFTPNPFVEGDSYAIVFNPPDDPP